MNSPCSVSLVIPAHNEENIIRETALSYYDALTHAKEIKSFEIILVSNHCSDNTPKVCRELSKKKNIIHLDFTEKIGKGGAVEKGFIQAKYDWLGFVDADNSIKPEQFLRLVRETNAQEVGAVIGSKRMPETIMNPPQPLSRQIMGWFFSKFQNILFQTGVNDSQCGAKIFRRKAIEPIHFLEKGFTFDVELLHRTLRAGYKIKELGVVCQNSSVSRVKWFSPIQMFIELIRLRARVK